MHKKHRMLATSSLVLVLVLVSMFGASFAFAKAQSTTGTHPNAAPSAKPATIHTVSHHTVNMQQVPAAKVRTQRGPIRTMPFLTGVSPAVYAQRKAAAAHTTHAPVNTQVTGSVNTPNPLVKFNGMADSGTICNYFGSGCQPPDQALATSSSWVFQGVNTSWAVYNTSGAIQSGWPKNSQQFFGVPNPGSCDTHGPFLSDPRAFYDATDGRFWAATLQVEGAFGLNSCPEQSIYWIAVSQTSNPNGTWNVYGFNMLLSSGSGVCPTCAADYTEFGFDQTAIYFSGNMFNQTGSAYDYAESFTALKSTMEAGSNVTGYGFYDFLANGVFVDTVQPVENETTSSPGAGLLIDSFNMNGDGSSNCSSSSCSGLVVWALKNPGMSNISVTGLVIATTKTYISPPSADEPGSPGSIETLDNRISGTPVFQKNRISFALETGVNNGSQVVPGIYWGQVKPTISSGTITGGTISQDGYLNFSGDRAASFGVVMETSSGNLLMVFDTMSNTIDPSIMYATRLTTTPKGTFTKAKYLIQSSTPTNNTRWGDYEATSYDGSSTNNTWFAAQYSGSNGDWATYMGEVHF